jgi:hypothetical protein
MTPLMTPSCTLTAPHPQKKGITVKLHPILAKCAVLSLVLAQTTVEAQNAPNKSTKQQPQSDIFNANNNPKGTDCYRRVAYIRKLENDSRFDTNKAMRQEWQRKIDEADRLKCKL